MLSSPTTTVLAPHPELFSDWLPQCFQWHQIFFDSMDTASCWVDPLSQWESCAGSCLSDSAPGLRSSPPSLSASTRWLSGGVQNNNKAVVGLSEVPPDMPALPGTTTATEGGGLQFLNLSLIQYLCTVCQHFILSLTTLSLSNQFLTHIVLSLSLKGGLSTSRCPKFCNL